MISNDEMSEDIQRIYNKTKNVTSPKQLDDLILGQIAKLENEPDSVISNNIGKYLPIAASVLVATILFQFKDEQPSRAWETADPVNLVKSIAESTEISDPDSLVRDKNQLPEIFFQTPKDINGKIVSACTANLLVPDENSDKSKQTKSNQKSSEIPVIVLYPLDSKKTPKCDKVTEQILK